MEENRDKELDVFLKKNIKEIRLEEPSSNFTTDVFSKIETLQTKDAYVHKPLISKWGWGLIGLLVVGITFFLFDSGALQESWFKYSKLEFFTKLSIFDSLNFISNTMVYGLIALVIFIYVQIFILKRHFSNTYQIK